MMMMMMVKMAITNDDNVVLIITTTAEALTLCSVMNLQFAQVFVFYSCPNI